MSEHAPDDPADAAALAGYATALADAVEAALPGWVRSAVERRCREAGVAWTPALVEATDEAAARCRSDVGSELRGLLTADVDDQRTTPLALLRTAVAAPGVVLAGAGVPPVVRDEFRERAFPEDVYDLAPAAFADLSPEVHEAGLAWGAAKAHVHLRRRRAEGRR
jgi:hypothetical protein